MASANSNQNVNDKLVIFKGDDTGGVFGRSLQFAIEVAEGADLTGCRAEWIFDGIVKTLDAPLTAGETREIFYSHNETERMCIGVRYGTFRIIDAEGKRATMTNTSAVEVTDNVARCYPGASAATVRIGTFISWENISGKPLLVKTVNGEAPDASGNIKIEEPVLDDTVTEKSPNGVKSSGIWSWVKSLLPNWLTSDYAEPATVASVADKRDKDDRAVYSVTRTENTDWTWTSENKELEAALNADGVKPVYVREYSYWDYLGSLPTGWTTAKFDYSSPHSSTNVYFTFSNYGQEIYNVAVTASRPRYMDESIGPAKQNQQFAAVATDDAAKPANGDLVKYDAANDRFVKAEKSSASSDPANADYRDPQDNTCHKTEFTEWICNPPRTEFGGVYSVKYDSEVKVYTLFDNGVGFEEIGSPTDDKLNLEFVGYCTATRSAVCTSNESFITKGYVDGEVSSAVSTNNQAFVSAVQNTPAPDPGQGEDPPWGTWGTVGAAIAGLVAGLKWLKDKVFDSAGNIQDQFATDLLGKPVANVKANTVSLASAYSDAATYSVGDAVTHDGGLYKCAVAITTAEAWTPEHWTETTVATLWNNADTTSYGGQN